MADTDIGYMFVDYKGVNPGSDEGDSPPTYGVGGDKYIIVPPLFPPSCFFTTFTFSDISPQGTLNKKFHEMVFSSNIQTIRIRQFHLKQLTNEVIDVK